MENPIKMDDLGVPLFSETSMLFMWLIPLVWRRWRRRKCCRLPHYCSTEEEQKEVKPPPRGWQMKLPEVRPQGNECSDDVTEGNLLTTSLLSEWGIESVWMDGV